jgi:hypothetical protein
MGCAKPQLYPVVEQARSISCTLYRKYINTEVGGFQCHMFWCFLGRVSPQSQYNYLQFFVQNLVFLYGYPQFINIDTGE